VLVPEVIRQLLDARVQQVGIFQHVVVEVVFGRQAQARALMRMLMSFDTSTTGVPDLLPARAPRPGSGCRPCLRAGLPAARRSAAGLEVQAALGILVAQLGQRDAQVDGVVGVSDTSASSVRETWRALRATSDMPFLWLSSSSSVIMGR
jgi:hypothetical protein